MKSFLTRWLESCFFSKKVGLAWPFTWLSAHRGLSSMGTETLRCKTQIQKYVLIIHGSIYTTYTETKAEAQHQMVFKYSISHSAYFQVHTFILGFL